MSSVYKSRCILAGSIIALFGLFFPLIQTTNVQTNRGTLFSSINYTATAYSVYSYALSPGQQSYWAIIACVFLSLFMGIATVIKQNWIMSFLLAAFQLGSTISFLWLTFQDVVSGTARANSVALFCKTQHGCNTADTVVLSNFVTVQLGLGFWLLVVGLLLSACGIYAPPPEETTRVQGKAAAADTTTPQDKK